MDVQKIIYLVATAIELTGVAIIADTYLAKKNGKKKLGFFILILGICSEMLWRYLK